MDLLVGLVAATLLQNGIMTLKLLAHSLHVFVGLGGRLDAGVLARYLKETRST